MTACSKRMRRRTCTRSLADSQTLSDAGRGEGGGPTKSAKTKNNTNEGNSRKKGRTEGRLSLIHI